MTPRWIFMSVLLFISSYLNAQTLSFLPQLPKEEQNAIETISLYPEKERTYILKATLHPEILVRKREVAG